MQPAPLLPSRPSASLPGDAAAFAGGMLPVLYWDGRSPTTLIGQVEARLAAGARFVVLARSAPCGRDADRSFLTGWWGAARPRLAGLCAGWVVLQAIGAARPTDDFPEFPVRRYADQAEALWWLRSRLAAPPHAMASH